MIRTALTIHLTLVYCSIAYAASGPNLVALDWLSVLIAGLLTTSGAMTMVVAAYGDGDLSREDVGRRAISDGLMGIVLGALVYGTATWLRMDEWQTFVGCGSAGLVVRAGIEKYKAFGSKGNIKGV